eukprot:2501117-Amphidinium_carterae.1
MTSCTTPCGWPIAGPDIGNSTLAQVKAINATLPTSRSRAWKQTLEMCHHSGMHNSTSPWLM